MLSRTGFAGMLHQKLVQGGLPVPPFREACKMVLAFESNEPRSSNSAAGQFSMRKWHVIVRGPMHDQGRTTDLTERHCSHRTDLSHVVGLESQRVVEIR